MTSGIAGGLSVYALKRLFIAPKAHAIHPESFGLASHHCSPDVGYTLLPFPHQDQLSKRNNLWPKNARL